MGWQLVAGPWCSGTPVMNAVGRYLFEIAHNVEAVLSGRFFILACIVLMIGKVLFTWPAAVATFIAGFYLLTFCVIRPQSLGFTSIEDYRQDYPKTIVKSHEEELSGQTNLFTYATK